MDLNDFICESKGSFHLNTNIGLFSIKHAIVTDEFRISHSNDMLGYLSDGLQAPFDSFDSALVELQLAIEENNRLFDQKIKPEVPIISRLI